MVIDLDTPVQFLKGVGPARARLLGRLGLRTVEDLLHHYPRRHEDRRRLTPIGTVNDGDTVTVCGRVGPVAFRRLRRRLSLVTVTVDDGTGSLDLDYWNQPWRRRRFEEGQEVIVSGRVSYRRGFRITNAEVEILSGEEEDEVIHTGRVVPVYGLTKGIRAGHMRRTVWKALEEAGRLPEYLPDRILGERGLLPLDEAVRRIHFPGDPAEIPEAARRLKYDEFFLFQTMLALRRHRARRGETGHRFRVNRELDRRIRRRFPFAFTAAQDRVAREIAADLEDPRPMTRLLQGDVGSGKTAVALYAILVAVANGAQAAIMAPTEILAEQHYRTFSKRLEGSRVRVELLVGRMGVKRRREILEGLASGEVGVAVGTHALIQGDVVFRDLGLAVVDEQHRFGVLQRAHLRWKGTRPDVLFLTATPIPRTLALTAFGDLDVSVIDEMPPGRVPSRTLWFPRDRIGDAYDLIREEIRRGRQAFFVFPLVSESEEMPLKAVTEEVTRLRREVFPGVPVGLIHGRLSREEKEAAMRRFREGRDRILAATTVVEVGIDVPNATMMVVEHADRYGLSQLHQLRGRIGRGGGESTFLLLGDPTTPEGKGRLSVLVETSDGFRIAEEDLRLRGPGEFFGTRQHGLPDFKIGNLVTDREILQGARRDAFDLVRADPDLTSAEGTPVRRQLARRLGALREPA